MASFLVGRKAMRSAWGMFCEGYIQSPHTSCGWPITCRPSPCCTHEEMFSPCLFLVALQRRATACA